MPKTPKSIFLARLCGGNRGQSLIGILVAIPLAAFTLAALQKSMLANLKGARDNEARETVDGIKWAINQVLAHNDMCTKTFRGLDLTPALIVGNGEKKILGAPVSIRMGRETVAAPGMAINNGTVKIFHLTEKDAKARKTCGGAITTTTYALNLNFSGEKRQYLGSPMFSSVYKVNLNAGSDNKVVGCVTDDTVCVPPSPSPSPYPSPSPSPSPIPAPTCTLAANPSIITLGQKITLTLSTLGSVTSSKINATGVANPIGTLVITPASVGIGVATGSVVGPGGNGTCSASYTVKAAIPVVLNVVINSAAYDGNGQMWVDFKTGLLTVVDCNGHRPGCVTSGESRNAGAVDFYDVEVNYVGGTSTVFSLQNSSNTIKTFAGIPPMWCFQGYGSCGLLPAETDGPAGTNTFQLPGDWSENQAGVVAMKCPTPKNTSRAPDSNPLGGLPPYWVDRLKGYGGNPRNIGVEVDDSYRFSSGAYRLPTTIHLSKDGVNFSPLVPAAPPSWASTGCNRQPGKP